ncbi:MAG: hypothetical protein K8R53_02710, partial [Bacteroidales bacterium]|nr:hypothetical protein [Bacteroidales bacterium]
FGEGIPPDAYKNSLKASEKAEAMIIIGTTGEVMPAAQMPYIAKDNGAIIIEINKEPTKLTNNVTDIFLEGKATEITNSLAEKLFSID